MMNNFTVTFWGVRGSHPTPQFSHFRYGGNTSCVEIHAAGQTLILDAGSGLTELSPALIQRARQKDQPVTATVLFSHLHHDHTEGLPFFFPAFNPRNRIHLFGPDLTGNGFPHDISAVMAPPHFPVALKDLHGITGVQDFLPGHTLLLGGGLPNPLLRPVDAPPIPNQEKMLTVTALRSREHPNDILYYRVGYRGRSVVYASDREVDALRGADAFARFARQTDLLIHDAQFTEAHYFGLQPDMPGTKGWGHSYTKMACKAALAAEARQLVLTHYDPHYDDATVDEIGRRAQNWFGNTALAYEGMRVELLPQSSPEAEVAASAHPADAETDPDWFFHEPETRPSAQNVE